VNVPRFLAVLAALLGISSAFADVTVGDTRDEALRQHGYPRSNAKRGNREYFVYPNGGRIEFADGKVVDVKGPLPVIAPAVPPPTAEEIAAAPKPDPASKGKPASVVVSSPTAPAPAVANPTKPAPPPPGTAPATPAPPGESAISDANSKSLAALSDHIDKMDTAWGEAPHMPKEHNPLDSIPAFLAGLVLRFALMIGALKLAFKFWEMDAFWKGVFAIAGIDVGLHAILELLGPVSGGLTTMSAVENGIPGIVLIFTINRFCFNKRIQNAVTTASAVKIVVSLIYIFAGIAMLGLAFG
jgi:hypothetical protein